MKINDCIWEDGRFKGKTESGWNWDVEASKVARADDLRLKLSYGKKTVTFELEQTQSGFYSSLWDWEIEGEKNERPSTVPVTCVHEWANQGFQHIVMACKLCGTSAPSWVKNEG